MNIYAWKLTHFEFQKKQLRKIEMKNFYLRQNTVKLNENRMTNIISYNIGHKTWDSERLLLSLWILKCFF